MQIFVDADACPVVDIVETLAEKYNISTTLLCDTDHILYSDYSRVIVVGAGADAVDYKLISICHKGDVVVSQDYGVAAMALGKGAYAIHQSGKWYTNENIDQMLMERHLNKRSFNPWVIMAVIADQANGREEISLNELLSAEKNIGKVFNLDSICMLSLLHEVEKLGDIKIIRTAGLDVVRVLHKRSFIDCVKKYYADIEETNS